MTLRTKRLSLAGASIALALAIGVLGVTAAQGDTTLAIPLPSLGDTLVGAALAGVAWILRRAVHKLDASIAQSAETNTELREFRAKVEATVFGRGGLVDDVRDLQSTVYREPRPVSPPAGFSAMPQAVAAKEPT